MKRKELELLRTEIQFLKNCQVRYFILSVATSGAVVGFAYKVSGGIPPAYVFLSPLLVILPCWWIFFDKATTISRIVGYLRFVELLVISTNDTDYYKHVGWENSLKLFRDFQEKQKIIPFIKSYIEGIGNGLRYGVTLRTTQKYLPLSWYTFLALSIAALLLSSGGEFGSTPEWLSTFYLFIVTAIHNLGVVGRLMRGGYSYDANFKRWCDVLTTANVDAHLKDVGF